MFTLVLAGCASGSPAVVAPTAPAEAVLAAPTAAETAPEMAAVVEEPTTAAPLATQASAPAVAVEVANTSSADRSPQDSIAFAQDVSALAPPAAEAAPAGETPPTEFAAAPGSQAGRLAPPPAPTDGTILHYYRGPSGRPEVALTFDAGADRGYAADILDFLRDEGILATFGMTGQWAEANPDLIGRMVAEGHQLINHTWSHGSLTGASTGGEPVSYERLLQELTDTETLVRELTGGYELKPYFRPPYGDIGPMTSGYLAQAGYYVDVLWSCDSFGWSGFGAEQIVERCTSAEMGGPGAIVLMHVGADAVGDFEALPGLIQHYRDNGYAFVTIEQMLQP
jgi:peptidoglycan/xylan/chitin deacetylase (PgdA/CDA1 family)